MPKTRKSVSCPVFGAPKQVCSTVLPTYEDVMKHYLFIRLEMLQKSNKEPDFAEIANVVISDVKTIWIKACLPVLSDRRIFQMLKDYHAKFRKIKKYPTSRGNSKSILFAAEAKIKLFDICYCKCTDFNCCNCAEKVPPKERDFLKDQRKDRKMVIAGVDLVTTKALQRKIERKINTEKRISEASSSLEFQTIPFTTVLKDSDESSSSDSQSGDPEFVPQSNIPPAHLELSQPSTSQMRVHLNKLALVCDRAGVSDRSAAMIASAVLQDVGIVNEKDKSKVIDRNKIRRARKKNRSTILKKSYI